MKKLLFIILLLNISILSYSLNFSVAPTGFVVDLKSSTTKEIYITNNTSQPMRLEAFFTSDPEFGEKYNLNSDITIFPKTISIKPGSKQTVRFRVKPDSKIQSGEYKSYLTFREVPQNIKTVPNNNAENKSLETSLNVITEIAIGIYGQKGDPILKGNLSNVKLDYNTDSILLTASSFSEGNTSLKFSYNLKVQGSDAEASGLLGISAREGNKDFNLITQLGPNLKGKKAKLVITDQNGKVYYDKVHTL
ncbi:fimbria/pilus periplasmic chaperone [Fusobacterium ulcerans]|uniref:fimbria/pilus periplasmic chaperone n=1 Tax=Fusobacterium ulcerans TaxID=861 RepID=UPI003FEECA54